MGLVLLAVCACGTTMLFQRLSLGEILDGDIDPLIAELMTRKQAERLRVVR